MNFDDYHTITSKRTEFLEKEFYELSFRDKKLNRNTFDAITNPAELFYIAHNHNWDDGTELLSWIISSPICDEGVAKLIFWRTQPFDYMEFSLNTVEEWAKDVLELILNIIENFNSEFYKNKTIYYNPIEDQGGPSNINEKVLNAKWIIPEALMKPTEGKKIGLVK